jgi:SRSO17 transposase
MTWELDAAGVGRLEPYFAEIGARLGEKRRRESFALHAMGILGEHERKSVEPLAAAAGASMGAQRAHDHLLHVVGQSYVPARPRRDDVVCVS